MQSRVLMIDDDELLGPPLAAYFQRFDLELICKTNAQNGIDFLYNNLVDLVILDVMLPEQNGFDVCRTIRKDSQIPIIMLTARGDVTDRVVGLELGADDYLSKPFEPRELVARIQNVLRRINPIPQTIHKLSFGDLELDMLKQEVTVQNEVVELTTREYQMLELFAKSPRKKFSRDEILSTLRGVDSEIYSRAIDIAVSRLRNKLKPTDNIRTVWGQGYTFIE